MTAAFHAVCEFVPLFMEKSIVDSREFGDWRRMYNLVEVVPMPPKVTQLFDNGKSTRSPDTFANEQERELYHPTAKTQKDLIGSRIETHSLSTASFNGKRGFVEGENQGRLMVRIDGVGAGGSGGKVYTLKSSNCRRTNEVVVSFPALPEADCDQLSQNMHRLIVWRPVAQRPP